MTTPAIDTTSLKLDAETKDRVNRLAESRHRSSQWVMLEAIREYVDREEKRDEVNRATLKAWGSYQQTGLHLTEDEADAWLEQLESGHDVEPPPCHV